MNHNRNGAVHLDEILTLRQQIADLQQQCARDQQELDALRAERDYFRLIADGTYDWDYWLAPNGTLRYVSPACERITGYRPDEFQAVPGLLERIIHPDDSERFAHHLHIEHDLQQPYELEFRIITRSGAVRWIGHACQPLYGSDGAWQGQRASNRDITERKEAEETYTLLVEDSLQALQIIQDGRIVFANAAATRLTGYSQEEMLALSPDARVLHIHPDDREAIVQRHHDRLAGKPVPSRYECRCIRKDGAVRWIEVLATSIMYGGKPAAYVASLDITERKEAEEAYRTLVDNSLQALVIFQDGRSVFANPAAAHITGYTQEELLAMSPEEANQVVYPDDRMLLAERARKRQQGEDVPPRYEFRLIRKDGAVRRVECFNVRTRYRGNPAVQMTYIDITERKEAEEALQFQAQILDSTGQSVIATTLDGIITYWNRAAEYLYGWTKREVLGQNVLNLTLAQPVYAQPGEIIARIGQGESWEGEFLARHRDGTTFPAWVTDVPFFDEQGQVSGVIGISMDITERKQAEEALRENRALLQGVMDYAPMTLYIKDIQGRYVQISQQAASSLGYTREQFLGKPDSDLFPDGSHDAWRTTDEQVLTTGEALKFEVNVPLADGMHSFIAIKFPIFNEHGDIRAIGGAATDITERKQAEEALRENRALLQGVLDHAPAFIFAKDLQGRITLANRQLEHLFEVGQGEMIGKTDYDFHAPEIATHNWAIDLEVQHTRQPVEREEYSTSDDGMLHTYLSIKFPLFDEDGNLTGTCGIATDITKRKRMEEALRASEARLARAEQIAHLGSWELDIASGKSIWSDEFFRICGFEPGAFEPTMEHGLQIIHPDDQTTAVNHVQQAIEQRATYDIEKRIVRPDGSIRRVHSVGEVICDEHQQPVTLSGAFLDITERKQAEEAVQRQWQFLRQVIDSIPAFIFARDHDGRFTLVNQTMADVYGTTVEALLGKTDADMHLDAQELERIRQEDRQVIDTGTELVIPERHIKDAHGRNRYFSVVKRLLTLPDDTADQVLVVGADITERKQAEEALRTSEQRLQAIFDNAAVGIGLADKTGQSILANARGAQQLGYTPEELAQYSNLELTHPDDRAQTVEHIQQLVRGDIQGYRIEKRYLRKDGSIFWADLSVSAVYDDDGLITYLLGIVVDITERKQLEHQLQHVNMLLQEQAIRDPLTGLHNRRYLDETLPRELHRAERAGQPVGVIMLDIDHFKRFNDTYGHDAGDALLQTMGTFLQRNTRGDDIACRYGGEEFTLVLPGASLADARQRAEELREGIQSLSVEHQGQPLGAVTASLGVAVFAAHGTTTDALVRAADQALYQAKRNGRNRVEVVTIPLSEECHIDIVK